jgi:hypothetical protein
VCLELGQLAHDLLLVTAVRFGEDLDQHQWVGVAMVVHDIDVGFNGEFLHECRRKCLFVEPVGIFANGMDQGPIDVCTAGGRRAGHSLPGAIGTRRYDILSK